MKTFEKRVLKQQEGMLLGTFLSSVMGLSKTMIRRLKALPEGIMVNGEHRTVRYLLQAGDRVSVAMGVAKPLTYLAENKPLGICYEDRDYLIVDKPPHITMYPRYKGEGGSLANRVRGYLERQHEDGTFHPISRLDIGTSGLVVLAKHSLACAKLVPNQIKKYYQTVVSGKIEVGRRLEHLLVQAPYSGERDGALFQVHESEGKKAYLAFEPLFYDEALEASGLGVRLYTGRRHQIRVQLSHIGHPLLGDVRYGGPKAGFKRPLLHAAYVAFEHPFSHEKVEVFLPMHAYSEEEPLPLWPEFQKMRGGLL